MKKFLSLVFILPVEIDLTQSEIGQAGVGRQERGFPEFFKGLIQFLLLQEPMALPEMVQGLGRQGALPFAGAWGAVPDLHPHRTMSRANPKQINKYSRHLLFFRAIQ